MHFKTDLKVLGIAWKVFFMLVFSVPESTWFLCVCLLYAIETNTHLFQAAPEKFRMFTPHTNVKARH